MNCLTEALGMGLEIVPFLRIFRTYPSGQSMPYQIMQLVKDIKPRDIMTEKHYERLTMDMALGCSTNSMLHLRYRS